jgi:hypothetical protein
MHETVGVIPALRRADIDAGQSTGWGQPPFARTCVMSWIRVWRSSRRVMRPRRFLTAPARRPFRPAPCPCGCKLPLQFLNPPTALPGLRRTGHTRLAEAGNRVLFPCVQRIQPLFAAPSAAGCLIHRRRGDHCLQSSRRCPTLAASQAFRSPALQCRNADPNRTRHHVDRRAFRRQRPRNYPTLVSLSVSSHCRLPAPRRLISALGGSCLVRVGRTTRSLSRDDHLSEVSQSRNATA